MLLGQPDAASDTRSTLAKIHDPKVVHLEASRSSSEKLPARPTGLGGGGGVVGGGV